uniref:hypothetical protein n=1 Tax=Legionella sainthelensi TaxID=28087 RepID=UPI001C6FC6F4
FNVRMLNKLIDIFLNIIYFTPKKEIRELDANSPLIRPKIIEEQSTKDDSFFSKSANDSCY